MCGHSGGGAAAAETLSEEPLGAPSATHTEVRFVGSTKGPRTRTASGAQVLPCGEKSDRGGGDRVPVRLPQGRVRAPERVDHRTGSSPPRSYGP